MEEERTQETRRRRRPPEQGRPLVSVPLVLGVAVVALIAVGGLIYLGDALRGPAPTAIGGLSQGETRPPVNQDQNQGTGSQTATPGAGATPTAMPPQGEILYDGNSKGATNAPLEIIEYADFQCPFCGEYARRTARQIDDVYVSRGLVRVTFRHFPFLGIESRWAANAAECAREQGEFWKYHDKLFANQVGENKGGFAQDKLKGFAQDLGLDTAVFNACVDSNKHNNLVREHFSEGERIGIRSTPTFVVNGQRVEGALPFANFQRIIETELAKKQ